MSFNEPEKIASVRGKASPDIRRHLLLITKAKGEKKKKIRLMPESQLREDLREVMKLFLCQLIYFRLTKLFLEIIKIRFNAVDSAYITREVKVHIK